MYEREYKELQLLTFGNDSSNNSYKVVDELYFSTFVYDAMWLAALALHKTEEQLQFEMPPNSLTNFRYANGENIRNIIYKQALNTTFNGASVSYPVALMINIIYAANTFICIC